MEKNQTAKNQLFVSDVEIAGFDNDKYLTWLSFKFTDIVHGFKAMQISDRVCKSL